MAAPRVTQPAPVYAAQASVAKPPARPAAPRAFVTPPPDEVEVQHPPLEQGPESLAEDHRLRREKLKQRLKAVRENPRPEPLPPSVAQAGVMVVARIATIQAELTKVKAINLALTQDLEGARRQAERATEEARLRMDEANRLANEVESRVVLLKDLERELGGIESERDEALLSLQDSRQLLTAAARERETFQAALAKKDEALSDSLSEEERLAGELESAKDEARALRRTVEAVSSERDTLARQVADLTAERSELLDARKALEAVHRALSQAVSR